MSSFDEPSFVHARAHESTPRGESMAVAEGIFLVVATTILSGLWTVGSGFVPGELTTMTAQMAAPSVQTPLQQLRNPIPPAVRPRPARPGIAFEAGTPS
jgi:hypothetical protein